MVSVQTRALIVLKPVLRLRINPWPMSATGQKATRRGLGAMSASPPTADITLGKLHVG